MRMSVLLVCLALCFALPLAAQESEFPTLAALEQLEIPFYDYADMLRRLSGFNPTYSLPTAAPDYQIGDRWAFTVPANDLGENEAVITELRGMTAYVLIWVGDSADYSRKHAQTLAERVERKILIPLQQLFDAVEPPGVDADPRLTVVMIDNPDFSKTGIFPRGHTVPSALAQTSNQREMMLINIAHEDRFDLNEELMDEVIAHEYQHILLHHRDIDEEHWLNEALSGFAEHYTSGAGSGYDSVYWLADLFLEAPNTGLTNLYSVEDVSAKYGAGALFTIFLAQQYGKEILAKLYAEDLNGWRGVDKVLRESAGLSADEVFADWVLANFYLDADRGFGYRDLDEFQIPPKPIAVLSSFPSLHRGRLPQYSTDYLAVNTRGADHLSLNLTQAPAARLIDIAPYEGDHFYYAVIEDSSNSRLTREINLATSGQIWLEYRIWYDLEAHYEYGYVEVSADGGASWQILAGEHTEDRSLYERFYDDGYTGRSDGWLHERIDLSRYSGEKILLRFEVYSDIIKTYRGLAIDDLRIDAIDYHDGFETADDAWIEEGWIRTDNRLPQRTWLQVVQENDEGLHLSRQLLTSAGELEFGLRPGVSQALVAISPVVPYTSLESEYTLEVNLLDDAGALMKAALSCQVTTTAALNFRDAPGGRKIGLLQMGTAVYALDSRDGWFNVENDGLPGWIHGDYVRTEGNCDF